MEEGGIITAKRLEVTRYWMVLLMAFAVGSAVWASEPLKGWVVDRNGAPVEGAKVYVKHQKNHTTSNDMGEFLLSDAESAVTIHVKIKKKVYDIAVGGRKSLYIVVSDLPIVDKENKYEDIGTRKIISGEELSKSGATDLVQALRGHFACLRVDANGWVKMNRACSLRMSPAPTWIVDGLMSGMPSLTVSEVESVEVDKEGLGYGLHGANGVIIVKTKRMK